MELLRDRLCDVLYNYKVFAKTLHVFEQSDLCFIEFFWLLVRGQTGVGVGREAGK